MSLAKDDREESEAGGSAEPIPNLAEYLEARAELGFRRMLRNLALEPPDPFKPKERRRAKKGFVTTAVFLLALIAWFAWFNVVR